MNTNITHEQLLSALAQAGVVPEANGSPRTSIEPMTVTGFLRSAEGETVQGRDGDFKVRHMVLAVGGSLIAVEDSAADASRLVPLPDGFEEGALLRVTCSATSTPRDWKNPDTGEKRVIWNSRLKCRTIEVLERAPDVPEAETGWVEGRIGVRKSASKAAKKAGSAKKSDLPA